MVIYNFLVIPEPGTTQTHAVVLMDVTHASMHSWSCVVPLEYSKEYVLILLMLFLSISRKILLDFDKFVNINIFFFTYFVQFMLQKEINERMHRRINGHASFRVLGYSLFFFFMSQKYLPNLM